MNNKIEKWIRSNYKQLTGSIAFYPAVISIGFLLLSIFMLFIDFSETGKQIKSTLSWSLKDASTARSILGAITAGIISLTVFSFSMVMILLNQAASQMSNRVLDSMIGNRFQQTILGFYIGTIVYSLFLLSTIRDTSSGVYVPALSIYLLLLFTIGDIFLFIYFLHYVTKSIKFDTIIKRLHEETLNTLKNTCSTEIPATFIPPGIPVQAIATPASNYYQGFDEKQLLHFSAKHGIIVEFLHPKGTYLLQGSTLMHLYGETQLNAKQIETLYMTVDFYHGQPIATNASYGYHQLSEIAIKALSPGINDPETAIFSVHALSDLLRFRLFNHLPLIIKDEQKIDRIAIKELTFDQLFIECFYPIWNYGKNDRYLQQTMVITLQQLKSCNTKHNFHYLFDSFLATVQHQINSETS